MTGAARLPALAIALGWLLLRPEPAHAWGPGTHVALGEALLASLYLVPPAIRALLEAHPVQFLYGSVAADISFAKKYVPEGRHCHHWHVGEEIFESADSDPLRAVGLGYLAHLAADTVAHNLFVPRQLLLTSTSQAMGHTYWEHRMDVHLGEEYVGRARRVVMDHDHSEADQLFDEVLSRTLFSFQTNRRIFQSMIRFSDNERWRNVFEQILQRSRFDLPDELVERYTGLSFDFVVDFLNHRSRSSVASLDPVGEVNLGLAKKVRHLALADGAADDRAVLVAMADDFFPLPRGDLLYWPRAFGKEEEAPLPGPGELPGVEMLTPRVDEVRGGS